MNNIEKLPYRIVFLLSIILCGACAKNFHPLNPEGASFPLGRLDEKGVIIRYDTVHLLNTSKNNRYYKNSISKNLFFIPVSIQNKADTAITLSPENLRAFNDYEPATLVAPQDYIKSVRQKPALYLLLD